MKLDGTSAVITGGGNGIGKAIALALADLGTNVAVADIDLTAAEAVAAKITERGVRGIAVATDVTQPSSIAELAERAWSAFHSVELLFNNAGVLPGRASVFESTAENARWVFSVNVEGVLNGIREFAPRFINAGKPAYIVNTGSEHSLGVPHTGAGLYTASKHAILGLSDVLRRELPEQVRVAVLCPGLVQSTLWRSDERRPEGIDGGVLPATDPARGKFSETFGMPAEEVAKRVIKGIEQDSFLIPTHAHVAGSALRRTTEIEAAFTQHAPRYDGDDKYDVEKLIARLTAESNR